tara:strand:+ start:603 stop:731 length:129 start_codon:yes stop_codon:yes gene_type:complete
MKYFLKKILLFQKGIFLKPSEFVKEIISVEDLKALKRKILKK